MSRTDLEIKIARSCCVLCGGPNDCALARDNPLDATPCWCVSETFPTRLQEQATERDAGASCICRACLAQSRSAHEDR